MGIFDGVLLISDYDNTLVHSDSALRSGTALPPVPERNTAAIRAFMAEGGRFTVATGRALAAFQRYAAGVPMNAPAVVNNGAGIYDFQTGEYLLTAFLPEEAAAELEPVLDRFPTAGAELYHRDSLVEVARPNRWTALHAVMTGVPGREIPALSAAVQPVTKVIFEDETPTLLAIRDALVEQGALERYELALSGEHLLEVTRKGANKGEMVRKLAALCGVGEDHIYCVGDHANDLPMLHAAAGAFAPSNAIDQVREDPRVTVVGHCQDGAIADVIALLEARYRRA